MYAITVWIQYPGATTMTKRVQMVDAPTVNEALAYVMKNPNAIKARCGHYSRTR